MSTTFILIKYKDCQASPLQHQEESEGEEGTAGFDKFASSRKAMPNYNLKK